MQIVDRCQETYKRSLERFEKEDLKYNPEEVKKELQDAVMRRIEQNG